jgi:2-polyprenyl-3-methyl-5-hydroxy-6-metoxy-1,4-benzoquinol methylase
MQWPATDPYRYQHFMGRWSERLAGPFLTFAGVSPGSHVLDVGCGTGILTMALAETGVVAVVRRQMIRDSFQVSGTEVLA